jgi:hypothetical protein
MYVRWDAVVKPDGYWSDAPRAPAAPAVPEHGANGAAVEVEVCLYGALRVAQGERTLKFPLPAAATLADVMGELRRRLAPEVLQGILTESGELLRCCRVFVDGMQAENPDAPVRGNARGGTSPALVEIILLVAAEGG